MVRRRQQTYPETVGARCGAALAGTLLWLSPAAALPFLQVLAATGCGRLRGEWAWAQFPLLGWSPAFSSGATAAGCPCRPPLPLPLYTSPVPFAFWLVSALASLWGLATALRARRPGGGKSDR
ncbi:hypothetical protein LJB68_06395 [bacterium 210820-DFI.6.52]|nr:hypothetical protein [bacterium 210820-DFI.6.52]